MALSVCLLMSRPILESHFHFPTVWRGFGMYEDTKQHNVISKLNQFLGYIPILHYDSLARDY